jgi:hypothetical protein
MANAMTPAASQNAFVKFLFKLSPPVDVVSADLKRFLLGISVVKVKGNSGTVKLTIYTLATKVFDALSLYFRCNRFLDAFSTLYSQVFMLGSGGVPFATVAVVFGHEEPG